MSQRIRFWRGVGEAAARRVHTEQEALWLLDGLFEVLLGVFGKRFALKVWRVLANRSMDPR